MNVSLVLVSHSRKLAEGVAELAGQMTGGGVALYPVGGSDDGNGSGDGDGGGLGTSAPNILAALEEALQGGGSALVLMDLGSAALNAALALELLQEGRERAALAEAPLVEGAVLAAVEAASGSDLNAVRAAAEGAGALKKLPD